MNLFDLFIKIGLKDEASAGIEAIAQKLGKGIGTAGAIAVSAVGTAAAAIAALTAGAIKNYAEYEQLVGGVKTLFQDSAGKVQQYAADAYKTAGISANQYMNTVTSFSASLLQSLGGDTEAAADLADRALRDMSDNANKMGTDMQTIIATYQSLSRGNFAMLDNLKLGYGGTKAEMERLIAKAAETNSAVKAGDMSFANMVLAISEVQEEMGIMGTTAVEAATTISGSAASMKAAWQNLITGVADDNADFGTLIDNFVESVGIAAENVIPRITIALNGVTNLITALFPQVMEALPQAVGTVLPQLAIAAVNVVLALVNGITQNADVLISTAMDIVNILVDGISTALPALIVMSVELITALAQGLADNASTLIPVMVDCVFILANALIENAPTLIMAGAELMGQILVGLTNSLPSVVEFVTELPQKIVDTIDEHGEDMVSAGENIVNNIMLGFVAAWNSFSLTVKKLINQLLASIHEGIVSIGGGELLSAIGIDGPLQISTTFEEDKIRDSKREQGVYINQNINGTWQSPAQLANATKAAFTMIRW